MGPLFNEKAHHLACLRSAIAMLNSIHRPRVILDFQPVSPSLGIDHIYIRVKNLDDELDLFSGILGLPLSWPVRTETFARYAWVNAGNVQLELWQALSDNDLPQGTKLPCFAGIALWPSDIQNVSQTLEAQGVGCQALKTWQTPGRDGQLENNFTNCLVTDASGPGCQVFFCHWNPQAPISPWPKGESTAERRARFAAELDALSGGLLGIQGLHSIHLETIDTASTANAWACIGGSVGLASPGVGLTLSPGPELRIAALTWRVSDLAYAEFVLEDRGMGTRPDGAILWIDPCSTHGLRLGLIGP